MPDQVFLNGAHRAKLQRGHGGEAILWNLHPAPGSQKQRGTDASGYLGNRCASRCDT